MTQPTSIELAEALAGFLGLHQGEASSTSRARATLLLARFDPEQARLEAAVVEAALATHTKRAYANQEFDTALYNLEAHIAAQEAGA